MQLIHWDPQYSVRQLMRIVPTITSLHMSRTPSGEGRWKNVFSYWYSQMRTDVVNLGPRDRLSRGCDCVSDAPGRPPGPSLKITVFTLPLIYKFECPWYLEATYKGFGPGIIFALI